MALSISGKSAIVTGAGSGINLEFARALLLKGCNVIFADLALRPEAQELVSNYANPSPSSAHAVFQQTDVCDWKALERMFDVAVQHFGHVDIVCPGAGIFEPSWSNFWHPPGHPPSIDLTDYKTLSVNLTHPIRTTQLAISHFLSSPPSSPKVIIHISSIAGQASSFVAPMYAATKHGINGFVRSLAPLETRLGIRVAAVAPGIIRTPLWTDHPDKMKLVDEDDEWVSPEFVAEVMVRLVEGGEVQVVGGKSEMEGGGVVQVKGGLILEVKKGRVRVVQQFMDEGPAGVGGKASKSEDAEEGILKGLEERGLP